MQYIQRVCLCSLSLCRRTATKLINRASVWCSPWSVYRWIERNCLFQSSNAIWAWRFGVKVPGLHATCTTVTAVFTVQSRCISDINSIIVVGGSSSSGSERNPHQRDYDVQPTHRGKCTALWATITAPFSSARSGNYSATSHPETGFRSNDTTALKTKHCASRRLVFAMDARHRD